MAKKGLLEGNLVKKRLSLNIGLTLKKEVFMHKRVRKSMKKLMLLTITLGLFVVSASVFANGSSHCDAARTAEGSSIDSGSTAAGSGAGSTGR